MAKSDWTEEDVALTERFRDALQEVKELTSELGDFTEVDVELAERYANALREIKEHSGA